MLFQFYGFPVVPFVPRVPVTTNIAAGNNPPYTKEDFQTDFPQFTDEICGQIPLANFMNMANDMLAYEKWLENWRYAMGLCVAHFAILHLQAGQNPAGTVAGLLAAGKAAGIASSKSVGDVSVSYDLGANEQLKDWGGFANTVYGQNLITLARIAGIGGVYVW